MVPGHEVAGLVRAVGAGVTEFKVGDKVGVGCMVDSCRSCQPCKSGSEQYCDTGAVMTYNGRQKYPHCAGYCAEPGKCAVTYGGYSRAMTVTEDFVCAIPDNLPMENVAPLLCAGITVFSPMQRFGLRPTHKFAVAGLGGLGHMAVKYAKAFGCHVTVLSRGTGKKDDAIKGLGADAFIDTTDADAVAAATGTFNFMIDTISADHDLNMYVNLLALDGHMVLVGVSPSPLQLGAFNIIGKRKTISGSLIGGIKETRDCLEFSGRHNIISECELIDGSRVSEAYERTIKSDVKYRFVIDCSTL